MKYFTVVIIIIIIIIVIIIRLKVWVFYGRFWKDLKNSKSRFFKASVKAFWIWKSFNIILGIIIINLILYLRF